ncbi:MAG: DUF5711 family protein [Methanobacteriota archaeon]
MTIDGKQIGVLLILLPLVPIVCAEGAPMLWNYEVGSGAWSVSTSAGGEYTAVGSFDNNVYLFDSAGRLLWKYKTGDIVWSVSTSADGKYIAAGSKDNSVYFFDSTGSLLWEYKTRDTAWSVSVSSDGRYITAGSFDNNVYLFDSTGSLLWNRRTGDGILSVSTSADGKYIAAGSKDNSVYFFDSTGKLLWNYKTEDIVLSVSMASDGSYIAAGSFDDNVYLFDSTGRLLWKHKTKDTVWSVSVSSDGRYVVAGSRDNSVYLFDSAGKLLWEYKTNDEVWDVSISADGSYIAAGSFDNNVYFFGPDGLLGKYATDHHVTAVSISSDGRYTSAGSKDNRVYFLENEKLAPSIKPIPKVMPPNLIVLRSITKSDLVEEEGATVHITIQNTGGSKAVNIQLTDSAPEGLGSVVTNWAGELEPGRSTIVSYTIKAQDLKGLERITYQLPDLDVTYKDSYGEVYHAKSPSIPITVTAKAVQQPADYMPLAYLAIGIALIIGIIFITRIPGKMAYIRETGESLSRIGQRIEVGGKQKLTGGIVTSTQYFTKVLFSTNEKISALFLRVGGSLSKARLKALSLSIIVGIKSIWEGAIVRELRTVYLAIPYKTRDPRELMGMSTAVIAGVEKTYEKRLTNAGFATVKDLADAAVSEVADKTELSEAHADYLVGAARAIAEAARINKAGGT